MFHWIITVSFRKSNLLKIVVKDNVSHFIDWHLFYRADSNPSRQILVPRTSPLNVPRTSPKDPTWPSQGRPDPTSRERPDVTLLQHLETTSMGRPNLTFKGSPWRVDSRHPVVWDHQLDVSKSFPLFFRNLFDWPNLSKSNSTLKVYWKPSWTSKMMHFLRT